MTFDFSAEDANAHLRAVDPVLGRLIDRFGDYAVKPRETPYASLISSIMFQQLAGAAARTILGRFLALFGDDGRVPTPSEILATTDEQFRTAGVSRQKAGYFRDLALHALDGRLDFSRLPALSDDEVLAQVTAVKGIGEWTAHMLLMFDLGRPDVLPVGDLGVRNGMRIAYGLDKTPTPAEARGIGAPWAPYRSVGSWYMWRAVEEGGR